MTFQGAVVKEQGVTFSIFIVKPEVLRSDQKASEARAAVRSVLPEPIILMAQDSRGVPTYQGRPDIVRFLTKIHPSRIPWKEYTVS
jgi:hypothetical protein